MNFYGLHFCKTMNWLHYLIYIDKKRVQTGAIKLHGLSHLSIFWVITNGLLLPTLRMCFCPLPLTACMWLCPAHNMFECASVPKLLLSVCTCFCPHPFVCLCGLLFPTIVCLYVLLSSSLCLFVWAFVPTHCLFVCAFATLGHPLHRRSKNKK